MLLDKTDNDDKLIDAIRAELNKVREKEATAKQELEQVIHVFSCVAVCVQLVSGLCRHSCGHRMMHSQARQSFKVRMSTAWVEEAATKKGVSGGVVLGGECLVGGCRFTSTQQVRMQEQHQLSLDVAKVSTYSPCSEHLQPL